MNSYHYFATQTNSHVAVHTLIMQLEKKLQWWKGRKVKMRNSVFLYSLVEYSYKINFWCFRALCVPVCHNHFLFVKLWATRKRWISFGESRKVSALQGKTYVRCLCWSAARLLQTTQKISFDEISECVTPVWWCALTVLRDNGFC